MRQRAITSGFLWNHPPVWLQMTPCQRPSSAHAAVATARRTEKRQRLRNDDGQQKRRLLADTRRRCILRWPRPSQASREGVRQRIRTWRPGLSDKAGQHEKPDILYQQRTSAITAHSPSCNSASIFPHCATRSPLHKSAPRWPWSGRSMKKYGETRDRSRSQTAHACRASA